MSLFRGSIRKAVETVEQGTSVWSKPEPHYHLLKRTHRDSVGKETVYPVALRTADFAGYGYGSGDGNHLAFDGARDSSKMSIPISLTALLTQILQHLEASGLEIAITDSKPATLEFRRKPPGSKL